MTILQKLLRAALYGLAPEKREEHSAALMLRPAAPLARPDAAALTIRPDDARLMTRPEPLARSRPAYGYPLPVERAAPLPVPQYYAPPAVQSYAPPPAPVQPAPPRRRRRKIVVTETFVTWREDR